MENRNLTSGKEAVRNKKKSVQIENSRAQDEHWRSEDQLPYAPFEEGLDRHVFRESTRPVQGSFQSMTYNPDSDSDPVFRSSTRAVQGPSQSIAHGSDQKNARLLTGYLPKDQSSARKSNVEELKFDSWIFDKSSAFMHGNELGQRSFESILDNNDPNRDPVFRSATVAVPRPSESIIHDADQNNASWVTGYLPEDRFSARKSNVKKLNYDSGIINKSSTFMRGNESNPENFLIGLSPQKKNNEQLPVSTRLKSRSKKKKLPVPLLAPAVLEKMKIKILDKFFSKSNTIVFHIPKQLTGKVNACKKWLRETVSIMYTWMESLAPMLTFMHHLKWLKFKGSYSYDYSVCYFDAQVWKVDPRIASSDNPDEVYILEFRRKSLTGVSAFEQLIRQFAGWLLENGRAKKYGNGFSIYPFDETLLDLSDEGSCHDAAFGSQLPSSVEDTTSDSDSSCQITLEYDLIRSWAEKIYERSSYSEENIRILAICSKDSDNRELMAGSRKLHNALCEELSNGTNPSSAANTLVIVKAIVKFHPDLAAGSFVKCRMLLAITSCLYLHSGIRRKVCLRSIAIERAALELLEMLIENQKLRFTLMEIEKVLMILVKNLEGKLEDQKNNKCLNNVIRGLNKKKEDLIKFGGTLRGKFI